MRSYTTYLLWAIIGGTGIFSVLSQYEYKNPTPNAPVCYEAYGSPVRPEYKATSLTVTVHWISEHMNVEGVDSEGAAAFTFDPASNSATCEVWIPTPVLVLGDAAMDTVGHEFLHCLTGDFHAGE